MASKIKVDQIQTADGTGTIALQNQLSGMTTTSLPAGAILQTVTGYSATRTTTTSTSFVTTSNTVQITPSSTSSKILILLSTSINKQSENHWGDYTLYRDSTNLYAAGGRTSVSGVYVTGGTDVHFPCSIQHIDSPNTTSAVTYAVYVKVNAGQMRFNAEQNPAYMYAIELKG